MMTNPKTTIPGLLLLLSAILVGVAHFILGMPISNDLAAIVIAIQGIIGGTAAIAARDGSA